MRVFYTDPLTGRDNIQAFTEKATSLCSYSVPKKYILLYTNVNNFKFINQSYGHEMGDKLIKLLSQTLEKLCGPDELCAHMNADHFVLLLHNKKDVVKSIRDALLSVLEQEKNINSSEIISCECGAYEVESPYEAVPSMISKATLALTQGKIIDGIAYYDDFLLQKLTRENLLSQNMHIGIEDHEFQIYLQPKIELATGTVVGVEVLCRWQSAQLGFLPPDEFVPLFEKNGFIVQLDFYMLEQTCIEFNKRVRADLGSIPPFSINFSRISLLQDNFIERFLHIVDKNNIPHEILEVEMTESAFIMEENAVIRILEELKNHGFKIVMDDFGLGYSSLNLLRKLPIDVLKMDKEFLREGIESVRTRQIIESVVNMAKRLSIEVVCEGVETIEQVNFLRNLGCQIGQGFYFSRPLSMDNFKNKYMDRVGPEFFK